MPIKQRKVCEELARERFRLISAVPGARCGRGNRGRKSEWERERDNNWKAAKVEALIRRKM